MANVDNGVVSPEKVGDQPGPARTRAGKPAGPAFKPMHHEDMDPQDFAAMMNLYDDSFRNMAEGEVVKGTVLKLTDTAVVVDVGYKSEGLIQISEFLDETGQVTVQPGDVVDVLLERTEDREGHIVLSREKAEKMKIWDEVEKAYTDRKVVIGRVIERIKGGLAVDIGVRAFLPGSQIDVRPVRNLDAHQAHVDLRAGQERADADVHRQTALDPFDDPSDHDLAIGIGLFDLVPDLHLLGLLAREDDVAFAILG